MQDSRPFQVGMGYAHPTASKNIQGIRNQQNPTNNFLIWFESGEKPYKCPKFLKISNCNNGYEKTLKTIKQII